MFEFPLLNDGLEDIRPTQDWDTVPDSDVCSREDWDAIIGEISNKVDGLIDNGQIDESASEQCMSTDTYLDFMTDIRDAIKPVVEYFYIKSWANRDLLAPLLLWLTEDFHSDYQPERYEADKMFYLQVPMDSVDSVRRYVVTLPKRVHIILSSVMGNT
jgi:hypothetical protein